jgi:hypothetical protein
MVSGWESLEGTYMRDSKAALDVISHIPTAYLLIIRLENVHRSFANPAHEMLS